MILIKLHNFLLGNCIEVTYCNILSYCARKSGHTHNEGKSFVSLALPDQAKGITFLTIVTFHLHLNENPMIFGEMFDQ